MVTDWRTNSWWNYQISSDSKEGLLVPGDRFERENRTELLERAVRQKGQRPESVPVFSGNRMGIAS
jgi:hypothetical protein